MVFSFFRKKDTDVEDGPKAAHPSAVAGEVSAFGHDSGAGIEVGGSDSNLSPAEEQAVVLYANGETADAVLALQAELPEIRGLRRLESWLLLFELYQQQNDRAAFDQLALEFVVEFEKTPPLWCERQAAPIRQVQPAGNRCTFGSRLTMEMLEKELKPFRSAVAKGGELRLDFSKVAEIDAITAAEILTTWLQGRKAALHYQVVGGANLARLLSGKIETGRSIPAEAPLWLLLIELQQSLGQQEEFENLAVEYAITYEVSPPSWDARLAPKQVECVTQPEPETPAASDEGLPLHGEISSHHSQALSEIRDYAKTQQGGVVLDFDGVNRVDFESAGLLLNLAIELMQQGHELRLLRINTLVYALLRLMGVGEVATLVRCKG